MELLVLAAGLGLAIGVSLGLLGGGGSILAVPALVYGLHQPVAQAVPVSLLVVGAAAAAGAVQRSHAGQVRPRVALVFGLAGVAASFAGAMVNHRLDEQWVLAGFAGLMVAVAVRMLRGGETSSGGCAVDGGDAGGTGWHRCLPRLLAAGAGVGFLTGLFGVGGGFVIVPALVLLLGLEMPVAIGTSLVVIVINSAAGLVAHMGLVSLDLRVAGTFAAGALAGAVAGGRLGAGLDSQRLRRWFGWLVLAVAVFVLAQTFVLNA